MALRQSIRLAFVAALQHLPPKQRAVLLMTEVLDLPANDVAESLDTSVAAVNSALQRARATLSSRDLAAAPALSAAQTVLVDRYVDAFERYDVPALTGMLHADATLSMPPFNFWLRGHDAISAWLLGRGSGCRGSRLIPVAASGAPAFGQYRPSGPGGRHQAWALIVLDLAGDGIAGMCSFLDTAAVFPRFGLPLELPAPA
jgi:RNA polymerase sigma-70 factor (ECF subfamily)